MVESILNIPTREKIMKEIFVNAILENFFQGPLKC